MEQQIRFCTSADGTRIAYSTVGEGPPLVLVPGWVVSHLEFGWSQSDVRTFYEGLATGRLLIRYDRRGTGLSDRGVQDISFEAQVRDLGSVVDALRVERFALMGWSEGGSAAISYAARNPNRVSHLILYATCHRWPTSPEFMEPLLALIRTQWGMGSAAMATLVGGSADPSQVAAIVEAQKVSVSGTMAAELLRVSSGVDVTQELQDIRAPTLIAQRRGDAVFPFGIAQEMAALIPNARLRPLEGDIHPPWWGDGGAILRVIDEFLAEDEEAQAGDTPSGTAVILFADIADSTALTERLGDAAFRERARTLDEALRAAITEAGGTAIDGKVLGDGVMATFASAREAIDAALHCQALGDGAGLPLHAGIHAGDVTREGGNVHGGAVQVAARIADASAPGEVLVSQTVRDLARTSAGVSFEDRGERELKGVSEPLRLFAVQEQR
ncbi:MAG: adenylate/guanylate cyclase domain-containing protein [Dehalococcoidia bacterium]